jgi:hypothetical protein
MYDVQVYGYDLAALLYARVGYGGTRVSRVYGPLRTRVYVLRCPLSLIAPSAARERPPVHRPCLGPAGSVDAGWTPSGGSWRLLQCGLRRRHGGQVVAPTAGLAQQRREQSRMATFEAPQPVHESKLTS